MNKFLAFVKKEFWHILRDKRTLLILIGMPLAQVLIFGYAITNEFRDASIVILDQAKDKMSQELTHKLLASGHLKLVGHAESYEDIDSYFKKGTVKLAVVIPPDFEKNYERKRLSPQIALSEYSAQVQFIADGTEPNYASTLIAYACQMIAGFTAEQSEAVKPVQPIKVETRMLFNPLLKSTFLFVPGVMAVLLMLISAMMTSLTIAREKEMGTMELLLVSPLHPLMIVVGKVVPYVFLAFLDGIIILSLGVFVFGVPINGSLLLLLGASVLYVLTALSLGVFISTRTNTQQTALMISLVGLMLPTVLLSDFIFPLQSMPVVLQVIGNAIPARWFVSIARDVMIKGTGIDFVWQEMLVLGGMTMFFLLMAMKSFKHRLT